ncbi:HNH endonuclease [Paracoccus sp. Z118]|uniref:HNH endonuclease n=1 Tax=Paracoccus sp. Z118 TaxID=2851017 RepID=UPI001C2B9E55|nr:HNH endonuclease [Paracoccus sp. Z118]MBV0891351.1 HNH endonuclease [Paracoccus sp. Z118]
MYYWNVVCLKGAVMPDFLLKPIFWNTAGYKHPSGARATSGFPKLNGFGHEEWNNSDRAAFSQDGVRYRAFHTERIGNAEPEEGASFVFMFASHDGVQDLVGIAGNATCLMNDDMRRKELADRLGLDDLWREAWDVGAVRANFNNDQDAFKASWQPDVKWIPNWICPAGMYLWLEKPVALNARAITGKERLIGMYSSYSQIGVEQALTILSHVPVQDRSPTWHRLVASVRLADSAGVAVDTKKLTKRKDISETTRKALMQARIGQGRFRAELDRRWGKRCAVTGCGQREVLRASHIKSWRSSSDEERLDSRNGLLLAAHIDALFDGGLISFGKGGEMLISDLVAESERSLLGLPAPLRGELQRSEQEFLAFHRRTYGFEA